jgi:hypothetical protein
VILAEDFSADRGPRILSHSLGLGQIGLLHLNNLIFSLTLKCKDKVFMLATSLFFLTYPFTRVVSTFLLLALFATLIAVFLGLTALLLLLLLRPQPCLLLS